MALQWDGLYDDRGLLASETTAPLDAGWRRHAPAPPAEKLERVLPREKTAGAIAAYAEAKPLKPSVQLALRIARDSTATVEDLARVVKQDQGLAARVLQLANSSLHRRGSPTRTVEQAIVRLGMGQLRETISSTAVLEQFQDSSGALNIELLWEHGYAVGMLASDLARVTRVSGPDEAFMAGLMHDIGRAAMAFQIGEPYIDALIKARTHDLPPARVEKSLFELNHADAAEVLFTEWDFDQAIRAPVANHHLSDGNIRHLDPIHYRHTKSLQAANALAHATMLGDSGSDWLEPGALDLGGSPLSPGLVRTCVQRSARTLGELRLMMASIAGHEPSPDHAARLASHLPDGLTLVGSPSLDRVDMLELVAWRLGARADVESFAPVGGPFGPKDRPDVALAQPANAKQARELAHALEAYDRPDARVPLVVAAADEAVIADGPDELRERPLHVLPSPLRLAWVVRAVNDLVGVD